MFQSRRSVIILGGKGIVGSALQSLMTAEKWHVQIIDQDQAVGTENYLKILSRTKKLDTWIIDLIPSLPKPWTARTAALTGHNYINTTSLNGKAGLCEFLGILDEHHEIHAGGKILLSAGANPGIVNIFGEKLVQRYGRPDQLISWEYDENTLGTQAVITWNREEFLEECTTGYWPEPKEGGLVKFNREKPCENLRNLPELPGIPPQTKGMVTPHEECIMLGWRHQCASYFYYAFSKDNPILHAIQQGQPIRQSRRTRGADTIGMTWKKGAQEYTMLARKNSTPKTARTNTTGWLVASGIMAAIKSSENLAPGCYTPEELPSDRYLESLNTYCDIKGPL